MLLENERLDDLQLNNLKIIQNKNYFCFGIDSILLSDFAKDIKDDSIVIDLGTGNGILPLLLSYKLNLKKIYGIEIQEVVANMAKRSVKFNKLDTIIEIVNKDIKLVLDDFTPNSIDAIVSNPPYMLKNSGALNTNTIKNIARHEISADLEDFISLSSKLLKPYSSLYLVYRSNRIVDVLALLRKYKLEPKTIRYIFPKKNKESNLFLVKAEKHAKQFTKILSPLIIYNNDNSYTDEVLKIYNKV